MSPLVSIIIPCYNQGSFIQDAISSVLAQTYSNIEIIIVNDGSTDEVTNQVLGQLDDARITVLNTVNQGLPTARNTAANYSQGKYILPLDADDTIEKGYVELAVNILELDRHVGIVYGRANYFGDKSGEWPLEKFNLDKMLFYNQIYPSGVYRKSDFDAIGGYDAGMKYGWEDWEFWLSVIERGGNVYFIGEIVFNYRVRSGSMVRSMTDEQKQFLRQRVYSRHSKLYERFFQDPISLYYDYQYYKTAHANLLSKKAIRLLNYLNKKFSL